MTYVSLVDKQIRVSRLQKLNLFSLTSHFLCLAHFVVMI